MSIPAPIKPSDTAKFKQTYLNNLKLQESNIQTILDAKRRYNETGEVNRSRDDMRTTTEKRADLQRLRVDVLGDLQDITDGTQAAIIISRLTPSELLFVADGISLIKKDMQSKYSKGVPSDIFIPYVQQLMRNAEKSLGVTYGIQGSAGEHLLNQNIIGKSIVGLPLLAQLKDLVQTLPSSDSKKEIISLIGTVENQIPTPQEMKKIKELDTQSVAEMQKSLSSMLEDVPTNEQVKKIIQDLEIAILKNDEQELKNIFVKIAQLLQQGEEHLEERNGMIEYLSQKGEIPVIEAAVEAYDAAIVTSYDDFKRRTLPFKKDWLIAKLNKQELPFVKNKTQIINASAPLTHQLYESWQVAQRQAEQTQFIDDEPSEKMPTSGRGLSKHSKAVSSFLNKIDPKNGIAKLEYTPFGKYFINTSRLADNVVQIRTKKNTALAKLKTQNISKDLSNVLKVIAGGAIPSLDEMNKLDKKDHAHLYTLAKESKIADRLSLHPPNKNEIEKENDRFFLLKGQIQSGNDNENLVKEFKKLLLKMLHEKRVPRREALEILEELVILGF
jgi:hypothetical protein